MKLLLSTFAASLIAITVRGQNEKFISATFFTSQNAMPFGKFSGLFKETIHPGTEIGYGNTFSAKKKHEWFAELRIALFYHRFVQVGIPITFNIGYRQSINNHFSAQTSIGAGYMHSFPATDKLKLTGEGEYMNNKGAGRMQAVATFNFGFGYTINPKAEKPIRILTQYEQRLQMPFVRSYVPHLPYNSFRLGAGFPLNKK